MATAAVAALRFALRAAAFYHSSMKTYLVGGAVRDRLLGLPSRERDWVVVGAAAEEMRAAGFRQVGKDFPVFLHPRTGEEYALARTERKTARGYHGFDFDTDRAVTLEQDLQRRDLTVNAMAIGEDGQLVDPYGGRRDLEARLLRHVSDAFAEDPVRVLRVARFAARFAPLGFRVADATLALMRRMAESGEIDALVAERVWQETDRALGERTPSVYFEVLRKCGALARIFPEVEALFGVPQPPRWHPEIDTGVHTLLALDQAASLTGDRAVRFAVLTHDLGKADTPPAEWPRHRGHEQRSVARIDALAERLRVPGEYRELAQQVARYHGLCHRALELRPATVLRLLEDVDAFRRPERFDAFLLACEADARGRTGLEREPYPQAERLRTALTAAAAVRTADLDVAELSGPAIGERLRLARVAAIAQLGNGDPRRE